MRPVGGVPQIDPEKGLNETSLAKLQKKTELSPDDFIKLFMAQMTHQNPLKPMDNNQMLQIMSERQSMLTSKSMQASMDNLAKEVDYTLGKTQMLQASQLINKKVEVINDSSPLTKDQGLNGSVMLPGPASDVTVTIKSLKGDVVKTVPLGNISSAGLVDFKWDGKLEDGTVMDPDFYKISATATVGGKLVPLHTVGAFNVNSVAMDRQTGGVILNVDGLGGINMEDIIKIL